MCRSIHTLYHIEPPADQGEIHAAALQFVRKVSGYQRPSKANEAAFMNAVDEIETTVSQLLARLETNTPARERMMGVKPRRQELPANAAKHEMPVEGVS
jgi:hypothetical protein